MNKQDSFIEKSESNTATNQASIIDKADPLTTYWLMPMSHENGPAMNLVPFVYKQSHVVHKG